jgi:hypothetical protein
MVGQDVAHRVLNYSGARNRVLDHLAEAVHTPSLAAELMRQPPPAAGQSGAVRRSFVRAVLGLVQGGPPLPPQ